MSKKLGNLVLQVQMENKKLLGKLEQTERRLKRFQRSTNKMASQFKSAFTNVMVPALTAFAAIAGKTFAEFEDTMLRVKAVSGATAAEYSRLTDAAMKMGRETRFTASQAAEGLQFLSMAGLSASDSIEALDETLQLALISGLDMARSADIITNVLSGFSLKVQDLSHVNDVLAQSITSSNQNLEEQAQALSKVAGIAPATNQSLEDMVAITQALANQGIKAEEAGTAIRMMLVRLVSPTGAAADIIKKYQIALHNADGTMRPLIQIMEDFVEKGVSQAEILEVFGARAGPKFIAAVSGGTDKLRLMSAELEASEGAAKNMAETIDSSLKASFLELKSKVEDVMITMGTDQGFGQLLSNVINDLKEAVSVIKEITGPILSGLGSAWTMVGAAMEWWIGTFGNIINSVISGVTTIIDVFFETVKIVTTQIDKLTGKMSTVPLFGKLVSKTDLSAGVASVQKSVTDTLSGWKVDFGGDDRSFDEIIQDRLDKMDEEWQKQDKLARAEQDRIKRMQFHARVISKLKEATDEANKSFEKTKEILESTDDDLDKAKEAAERLAKHGFKTMEESAESFSINMTDAMRDAAHSMIVEFEDIGDAFEKMGQRMLNTLANTIFDQTVGNAIAQFGAGLFGGGSPGIGGGFFGNIFGGLFADGGQPPMGKVSVVGEEGPELFVPNTRGTIVPNHLLSGGSGGGTTVIQNISVHPDVPSTTRRVIFEQLPMIKEAAAAGVEQKVLRGGQYSKNIRGN